MRQIQRRPIGKARATLLWAVLLFAAGQLVLGLFVHRSHPELCDPAFTMRLRHLRNRLAEGGGRPLVLVLGSSRPALAFRPSLVRKARPARASEPVLFNFSFVGAGPVREWMMLRRLLAEGVRPDWLLLEVWWPFLAEAGIFNEEEAVLRTDWDWVDVPLLAHFYHKRWAVTNSVIEKHLTPALHYRLGLANLYASFLLPAQLVRDLSSASVEWCHLDEWGAQAASEGPSTPDYQRYLLDVGQSLVDPILRDFRISALADNALRALLNECRDRGIKVALFVMPEHSALRARYSARMKTAFHRYLAQLRDENQVPVIDARGWCRDEEFGDLFHLFASGARTFSERFGRDVYRPLMEGKSPSNEVLFREDAPLTSAPPPSAGRR